MTQFVVYTPFVPTMNKVCFHFIPVLWSVNNDDVYLIKATFQLMFCFLFCLLPIYRLTLPLSQRALLLCRDLSCLPFEINLQFFNPKLLKKSKG